jgi:hypothetical protein
MENKKNEKKEIALFIIGFLVLFFAIQNLVIPRYMGGETDTVKGFYKLEKNSLDVMFFGSSAIFRSVDTPRLTEEYGINAYNMCAGSQQMTTTYYYMQEALKTQSPQVVFVEVGLMYRPNTEMTEGSIPWSYAPTKMSLEKYQALKILFDGDIKEAVSYSLFPILAYHESSVGKENIKYYFGNTYLSTRGYYPLSDSTEVEIAYLGDDDGVASDIPDENQLALLSMRNLCAEKGVKLIFIKIPNADWTRTDSATARRYFAENGMEFIDLNDNIADIGLDSQTDFYDIRHLNKAGSDKLTEYMAKKIIDLSKGH